MADIGLVDAAVMAVLAQDPALAALCPDGVYWGIRRPEGGTAFVIVALFDHTETPGLGGTLFETTTYLVRATVLGTARPASRQAAQRIYELLHDQVLDLAAAGYQAMDCRRVERVAYPEPDPANSAIWHHAGGQYRLMHYPTT